MYEQLTHFANQIGVRDVTTAGIWLGAGFVLGLIMVGRRPLGLIGDLIAGLVGGAGAGYAFDRFAPASLDLAQYPQKLLHSLSHERAEYVVAFVIAFVGALILLILMRLLIRR
jgi:uncharacterized membrane protein YeaQ/YmgE (transglycosylase-associated protein family)